MTDTAIPPAAAVPMPRDSAIRAPVTTAGDLSRLIACPHCDALYVAREPALGERVVCARCHTVLIAPRAGSLTRVVALALTVVILMAGALFFPFLDVDVAGITNASSIFGAVRAFADGGFMTLLSVGVAAVIVGVPVLRAALVCWVIVPLLAGRPPAPQARRIFRLSERLQPWSMAEIFVIGCAVALVKVADLAQVGFGPAFWLFAALVVVIVLQDAITDRWTIWKALDEADAAVAA